MSRTIQIFSVKDIDSHFFMEKLKFSSAHERNSFSKIQALISRMQKHFHYNKIFGKQVDIRLFLNVSIFVDDLFDGGEYTSAFWGIMLSKL